MILGYLFFGFIYASVVAHYYAVAYCNKKPYTQGEFITLSLLWPTHLAIKAGFLGYRLLGKWLRAIQFIPWFSKLDDPIDPPITIGTKYSEFPYNKISNDRLRNVINLDRISSNDRQKVLEKRESDV